MHSQRSPTRADKGAPITSIAGLEKWIETEKCFYDVEGQHALGTTLEKINELKANVGERIDFIEIGPAVTVFLSGKLRVGPRQFHANKELRRILGGAAEP